MAKKELFVRKIERRDIFEVLKRLIKWYESVVFQFNWSQSCEAGSTESYTAVTVIFLAY